MQKDDALRWLKNWRTVPEQSFVAPIYFRQCSWHPARSQTVFYSMFNPASRMAAPDPWRNWASCSHGSPKKWYCPWRVYQHSALPPAGFHDHKTPVSPWKNPKTPLAGNEDYQKQIEELGKWLGHKEMPLQINDGHRSIDVRFYKIYWFIFSPFSHITTPFDFHHLLLRQVI